MVELLEKEIKELGRPSSKGNQLKWERDGIWYKADYCGYEGLAEYAVSEILKKTDIAKDMFVCYDTEEISYKNRTLKGCKSGDFLPKGWSLITLERLFREEYARSFHDSIYAIAGCKDRLQFLVDSVEKITGLKDFGKYMSSIFELDMITLNEDRHTHNLAVLRNPYGEYRLCPIFDNGAALLSDTSLDYPMDESVDSLFGNVKSATIAFDFEEQADAAEQLYGVGLKFHYTYNDVKEFLDKEAYYPQEIKDRVQWLLLENRRRYEYLFV